MALVELFLIAIGLSMDAFAVSVCKGFTIPGARMRHCVIVGLYFGVFQAIMPLIGFFAGMQFARFIAAYDHWIAFALLALIGGKMIKESFEQTSPSGEASLHPKKMLPLAVATSIDALAVGISFAFLDVSIGPAVLIIGVVTFLCSAVGVKLGKIFGSRYKSRAELAGGVILVLIGLRILLEHLGVI